MGSTVPFFNGSATNNNLPQASNSLESKLKLASEKLSSKLDDDRLSDLHDLLRKGSLLTEAQGFGADRSNRWPVLKSEKFAAMPELLLDQFDQTMHATFVGLLPDINHAWFTVDNKLGLWNYNDWSDFLIWNEQDQIINCVALVKPVPGVFMEEVEYLLVIATTLEVILLGVTLEVKSSNLGADKYCANMQLYVTGMTVPTDDILICSISGTDSGRIFLGGKNGHLYELQYQAEEGWFTKRCQKIDQFSALYMNFVPSFITFWNSEDPIVQIEIDNSTKMMFILFNNNSIEVVYLGPDGKGFERRGRLNDIYTPAQVELERYSTAFHMDANHFHIVSIHAISELESTSLNLVAVTSNGCRIYFSITSESIISKGLRVVAARPPVNQTFFPGRSAPLKSSSNAAIHVAYYAAGLVVAANSVSEDTDSVIGACPDAGVALQHKALFEQWNEIQIHGKTWVIAEAKNSFNTPKKLKIGEKSGTLIHELSTQLEFPQRNILVMTNAGIHIMKKIRPVDILQRLLKEKYGLNSPEMKAFFEDFGTDQTCAMLLAVICLKRVKGSFQLDDKQMIATATHIFFEGGSVVPMPILPTQQTNQFQSTPAVTEPRFSGRHNGLALYLARIFKPVWKFTLTKLSPIPGVANRQELRMSVEDLQEIQGKLLNLNKFLTENEGFTSPPNPVDFDRLQGMRQDMSNYRAEQESLHCLHELIRQSIEAISLILLLNDYDLPTLVQSTPDASKKEIQDLTFEKFVGSSRGREIGKLLMTNLVNKLIDENMSMDAITNALHQNCPTFCQDNDIVLYRGFESLQRAKSVQMQQEREIYLREAFTLFIKVVDVMPFEKLQEICENFKGLGFHAEAVDLVLRFTVSKDPGGLALTFANDGYPQNDVVRGELFEKRRRCYMIIIDIIRSVSNPGNADEVQYRRQVLERAFSADDRLLHETLFEWFIENGMAEQLLTDAETIDMRNLEQYLSRADTLRDMREPSKYDLLWKYYGHLKRNDAAANVLMHLGTLKEDMPLQKRREYISLAIAYSRGSADGARADDLRELEDLLDVINVQDELMKALRNIPGTEQIVQMLEDRLQIITDIFRYAKRHRLYEVILRLMQISDARDPRIVEASWEEIMNKTVAEAQASEQRVTVALSNKIKQLAQKLTLDANVFPIPTICSLFEAESYRQEDKSDRGWLVRTLRDVGVRYGAIFQVYHELFETKLPPWQSNDALGFLIDDICILINDWYAAATNQSGMMMDGLSDGEEFPVQIIEDAVNKYLTIPDAMGREKVLRGIQGRIRSRFGREY
ncbi:hypothetical protein HK098_004354 [Nowakowskiella sp. JEL0407]|nr:hypothetical protein HK098_004354 [Nowakowskiella sp. JEL0407]